MNGIASEMMHRGYDPADPKVELVLERLNANPNLLPQYGMTWQQLIALNNEVKRLKQGVAPPPPTDTVANQLSTERKVLEQGLPTAMPVESQMFSSLNDEAAMAGGGIIAFANEGKVPKPEGDEKQTQADREAILDTLERLGAAGLDIATLPGRGVAGAFESAVTRPLRAAGVPIPYLPKSFYGGDASSITPYYDKLRSKTVPTQEEYQQFPPTNAPRTQTKQTTPVSSISSTPRGEEQFGLGATPEAEKKRALQIDHLEKQIAAEKASRRAFAEEVKPKSEEEYTENIRQAQAKEGIGKADQERKAALEARQAGLAGKQSSREWLDLAAGFFDMAKEASKGGQPGGALAGLLRSGAAGGASFAERVGKTRDKYQELSDKLEDAQYEVARAEEARKAGVLDKGSAKYQSAMKNYTDAQEKMMKLDESITQMRFQKAADIEKAQMEIEGRAAENKLNRATQERIAGMMAARGQDKAMEQLQQEFIAAVQSGDAARIAKARKAIADLSMALKPSDIEKTMSVMGDGGMGGNTVGLTPEMQNRIAAIRQKYQ